MKARHRKRSLDKSLRKYLHAFPWPWGLRTYLSAHVKAARWLNAKRKQESEA